MRNVGRCIARCIYSKINLSSFFQISDFGMSRDVVDENYYVSHGGKVPVKWTAPEVWAIPYNQSFEWVV